MNFPTPLIVDTTSNHAISLPRLNFKQTGDGGYNEAWVQKLIDTNPSVLPIIDIEPAFTPTISVCMELPLSSGSLDNLLVTPMGNIIAVECKLWRNPEARRTVIAQIIDYAKDLQRSSYSELETAIRRARGDQTFSLYQHVAKSVGEPEPPLDEPRFIDAVSNNLRRGRCLLLIVGDGLKKNIEAMTEFLQQHAGMHFALALVQLAIHEVPETSKRIIIPSVPLRTTNIVRAIVQLEVGGVSIVSSTTPNIEPSSGNKERGSNLSEGGFFATIDKKRPGTSDRLKSFLAKQEDLHVQYDVGGTGTLRVRMVMPDNKLLPFVVNDDGKVDMGWINDKNSLLFGDRRAFAERLAAAIPGADVNEMPEPKLWFLKKAKKDGTPFTVWDILDHQEGCRAALEVLHKQMLEASSL